MKELGVPVNFTPSAVLPNTVFFYGTADPVRTVGLDGINSLLETGVKVAMMYGDRDYRCPWNGAEKLSLAAHWSGAEAFRDAGYQYIVTNASYNGGAVRQYGNFSFSRFFEAGHSGES